MNNYQTCYNNTCHHFQRCACETCVGLATIEAYDMQKFRHAQIISDRILYTLTTVAVIGIGFLIWLPIS